MLQAALRGPGCDLEALETAIRDAVLAAGAKCLEEFMNAAGAGRRAEAVKCLCGGTMQSCGVREKRVLTMLGVARYRHSLFQCPGCKRTRYPGDEALDIVDTSRSPGVRRQTARLGAKQPFGEVVKDLRALAGIDISRKDAERLSEAMGESMEQWDAARRRQIRMMEPPPPDTPKSIDTLYIEFDGTGVPMTKKEVAGRKGKQKDGGARTREAKLGCVFTQTAFDERGRPIRDPASTTFTGGIETAAAFGWRIYAEAVRRGLYEAKRVIVLTDGAEWIKGITENHFPGALHIIDLYHAREHLVELCRQLFDRNIRQLNRYKDRWWSDLDKGDIEKIIREAKAKLPRDPTAAKDARLQIGYLEKNIERMRYGQFKAEGLFPE